MLPQHLRCCRRHMMLKLRPHVRLRMRAGMLQERVCWHASPCQMHANSSSCCRRRPDPILARLLCTVPRWSWLTCTGLGARTPTSSTSNSLPVFMSRMSSPAVKRPSTMRKYTITPCTTALSHGRPGAAPIRPGAAVAGIACSSADSSGQPAAPYGLCCMHD